MIAARIASRNGTDEMNGTDEHAQYQDTRKNASAPTWGKMIAVPCTTCPVRRMFVCPFGFARKPARTAVTGKLFPIRPLARTLELTRIAGRDAVNDGRSRRREGAVKVFGKPSILAKSPGHICLEIGWRRFSGHRGAAIFSWREFRRILSQTLNGFARGPAAECPSGAQSTATESTT